MVIPEDTLKGKSKEYRMGFRRSKFYLAVYVFLVSYVSTAYTVLYRTVNRSDSSVGAA